MKVLFVSQRKYTTQNGKVFTSGALGAETGEFFSELFPDLLIIGRQSETNTFSVRVDRKEIALVQFNLRSITNILRLPITIFTLYKLVSSRDAVIARLGGLATLVAVISLVQKKPLGVEIGGCVFNSLWNYGTILGKILAPFSYLLRLIILWRCHKIQMVTQAYLQKRYLIRQTDPKCLGISNVNIKSNIDCTLNHRKAKTLKRDFFVIGSIGSFNGAIKGHDIAVETCYQLNRSGYRARLNIIGPGDHSRTLRLIKEKKLEDYITLYEPVSPGKQIESWLNKVDIYCQFSRREGISRSVLEAMNLSIPVVASDVGGTFEIVHEDALYKVGNINSVVTKISQLIDDNSFYKSLCDHSHTKALEFDQKLLAEKRKRFWNDFGKVR